MNCNIFCLFFGLISKNLIEINNAINEAFLDPFNHLIQDVAAAQQLVKKRRVNDRAHKQQAASIH